MIQVNRPVDLSIDCGGIKSPNPFWLASGPPTNTYGQVAKAFDAGWGGAVWKTIGEPIINVFSRYGSLDLGPTRMMGFNNIELISDRPVADNLKEIALVKRNYPKHACVASLMVESKQAAWHEMVKRTQDTGADGIELNFGCPHGMSERGMGSAVGQVPDYTCQIVEWVKEVATIPVIVKLTPNVTDVTYIARAAVKGGADAPDEVIGLVHHGHDRLLVRDRDIGAKAVRRAQPLHDLGQPLLRGRPDLVAHVQPHLVERRLLEGGRGRLLRRVADDADVADHGWNSSMFCSCSSNVSAKAWEPSGLATKKR